MLTALAVILLGLWLVLKSQGPVSQTFTLIIGIVAMALAVIDLTRPYWNRAGPNG